MYQKQTVPMLFFNKSYGTMRHIRSGKNTRWK